MMAFSRGAKRSSTAGGPRSRGGSDEGGYHRLAADTLRAEPPRGVAPNRRVRLGEAEIASLLPELRRARESRLRAPLPPLPLACCWSGETVSESSLSSCPKSLAAGDTPTPCGAPKDWRTRLGDKYSIAGIPKLPVASRVARAAEGGCMRLCVARFSAIAPGTLAPGARVGSVCPRPKAAVVTAALPWLISDRTWTFMD